MATWRCSPCQDEADYDWATTGEAARAAEEHDRAHHAGAATARVVPTEAKAPAKRRRSR